MTIKFDQFFTTTLLLNTDIVVGLRNAQNYQFPMVGIGDSNGHKIITWTQPVGVGANYIDFLSAASGTGPTIRVLGGDVNSNFNISALGTGHVAFTGTGAIAVPVGTTGQQPVGFAGGFRYNSTTDFLEYWDVGAAAWVDVINGAALAGLTYVTENNETADLPNSFRLVGTANRVTATYAANILTLDISAAYVGQTSITTLGTITTGVWHGTAVDETHGGTNQTTYALGDTLYASAANTLSKLAGNTTAVKQYLSQTGTGAVSAAPVWASISGGDITGAALSKTDDTNVTLLLGGTPLTALLRATSLTLGWAGQLAVTRGGTGLGSVAQGDLLYGSAANTYSLLNKDTNATRYLSNQGTSNNPSWNQVNLANGVTGFLPIGNIVSTAGSPTTQFLRGDGTWVVPAGTGVTSVSGTANRITSTGGTTPVIDIAATYVGQASITTVGALSSGSLAAGFTPVTVPIGGTGNTTFTAFSVICAGTTATGAFQNVSGLGSLGNVLTSQGPGALPIWAAASAGSVTSVATGVGLQGGPITTSGTVNLSTTNCVGGRLTFSSGAPVPVGDVTGASTNTLYYCPYKGFDNDVYSGSGSLWTRLQSAQISIATPATTGTLFDVFMYNNAGTLTLELSAGWASNSVRTDALAYQDGVLVKSADHTRRYLGTFKTTGVANQSEDSAKIRLLYNYYNRVSRSLAGSELTASWTYTSSSFHQTNASVANQVEAVVGVQEDCILLTARSICSNPNIGVNMQAGIGINSTTTNTAIPSDMKFSESGSGYQFAVSCSLSRLPTLGYSFYAWLEASPGGGTTTWYSSTAATSTTIVSGPTGLSGSLMM